MADSTTHFDCDQFWLSERPEFDKGWDIGISFVDRFLDSLIDGLQTEFTSQRLTSEQVEKCRQCVWGSWRQFWKQCIEFYEAHTFEQVPAGLLDDHGRVLGIEVANLVQGGIRPTTGKPLGGNPFRDLVLATAALAEDEKAVRMLESEYASVFDQEARRMSESPDPDTWLQLVNELVWRKPSGEKVRTGRLQSYRGYSSLRVWLRPVIRNFLIDRRRNQVAQWQRELPSPSDQIDRSPGDVLSPEQHAIQTELVNRLRIVTLESLSHLPQPLAEIVVLSFSQNWQNQAIGSFLGIHPGNVSRQRKKSLDQLVILVRKALESDPAFDDARLDDNSLRLTIQAVLSEMPLR